MVKEDVLRRIDEAKQGRELWIDLIETYGINNNDQVILFPSEYDEWAYYGAVHLDRFIKTFGYKRAIALCHDEKIMDCIREHSINPEIHHFSREKAEKLMAFYSLYLFTDNLIIFSPNEPAGRNGNALVGKKGITVEDVVVYTLYRLNKLSKPDKLK